MTDIPHVIALAFNAPLLIDPAKAEVIATVLLGRLRDGAPQAVDRFNSERKGVKKTTRDGGEIESYRYAFADGVARIDVQGTLVNRGAWIGASSGLTSYEGLSEQIRAAVADSDVKAIALDIDSPGGQATGAFEIASLIRDARKSKRVTAFVNGLAASAAYAIASAADEIVLTRSSYVGSIGVVMMHLDFSAYFAKEGVRPTLIFAGAHKVDGNPYAALPDAVRTSFQTEIDQLYQMFVDEVGAGRHALGEAGARATEARTFMGEAAITAGLADRIGAIAEMRNPGNFALWRNSRRTAMAGNEELIYTQAAHDAAVANAVAACRRDMDAAHATAVAEAKVGAATGERARIKAIFDGDAAKGRASLARHFALSTDMSPEAAQAALAAAAPEASGSRMDRVTDPAIKPGAASGERDARAANDTSWTAAVAAVNAENGFAKH